MTTADESIARRELEKKAKAEGRIPPGQSLTLKWPILHYGSVPHFDAEKWDFKISVEVETPVKLSWKEFGALPQTEVTSDFHCVTRWSRLDNRWKGVLFTEMLNSLRDALEPAGQSVEGRVVYGNAQAGEAEGRGKVCVGAGGRGIHGECAAGGFDAAGCAVCV